MVDINIQSQLYAELERMPLPSQRRVLDFARTLSQSVTPRGTPGKELLRFAGKISKEDCELMEKAIEEAFEQVDPNDW